MLDPYFGAFEYREVPGGFAAVWPALAGRARLEVRARGGWDAWLYDTPERAVEALREWSGRGEPEGWVSHPLSGRERVA